MDELDELDRKICELRGEYPMVKHLAMNADETSYSMEFDDPKDAADWFHRFPKYAEQYHYVRREYWRPYTRDIAAAWELVEDARKNGVVCEIRNGYGVEDWQVILEPGDPDLDRYAVVYGSTAPEAIARAWVMWKEVAK